MSKPIKTELIFILGKSIEVEINSIRKNIYIGLHQEIKLRKSLKTIKK